MIHLPPALEARIDQETADIREMLDRFPAFSRAMKEPGPYRDGARLVAIDCLEIARRCPERVEARLWAWDSELGSDIR